MLSEHWAPSEETPSEEAPSEEDQGPILATPVPSEMGFVLHALFLLRTSALSLGMFQLLALVELDRGQPFIREIWYKIRVVVIRAKTVKN